MGCQCIHCLVMLHVVEPLGDIKASGVKWIG